jgi:hypothetical protein
MSARRESLRSVVDGPAAGDPGLDPDDEPGWRARRPPSALLGATETAGHPLQDTDEVVVRYPCLATELEAEVWPPVVGDDERRPRVAPQVGDLPVLERVDPDVDAAVAVRSSGSSSRDRPVRIPMGAA